MANSDKTEQKEKRVAKPKAVVEEGAEVKPRTAAKPRATAKPKTETKPKTAAKAKTAAKPKTAAKEKDSILLLVERMAETLASKKATDIVAIKVEHLTTLADYFLICSARNTTQVRAIYDALDDDMQKLGRECRRREGIGEARWIAMDYGDVLVHIFLEEVREFYQLERLWTDGLNTMRFE